MSRWLTLTKCFSSFQFYEGIEKPTRFIVFLERTVPMWDLLEAVWWAPVPGEQDLFAHLEWKHVCQADGRKTLEVEILASKYGSAIEITYILSSVKLQRKVDLRFFLEGTTSTHFWWWCHQAMPPSTSTRLPNNLYGFLDYWNTLKDVYY